MLGISQTCGQHFLTSQARVMEVGLAQFGRDRLDLGQVDLGEGDSNTQLKPKTRKLIREQLCCLLDKLTDYKIIKIHPCPHVLSYECVIYDILLYSIFSIPFSPTLPSRPRWSSSRHVHIWEDLPWWIISHQKIGNFFPSFCLHWGLFNHIWSLFVISSEPIGRSES